MVNLNREFKNKVSVVKNYGYIYKTLNLLNNKIYIGQKKGKFNSNYFGSGLLIRRSIKLKGINNFR